MGLLGQLGVDPLELMGGTKQIGGRVGPSTYRERDPAAQQLRLCAVSGAECLERRRVEQRARRAGRTGLQLCASRRNEAARAHGVVFGQRSGTLEEGGRRSDPAARASASG